MTNPKKEYTTHLMIVLIATVMDVIAILSSWLPDAVYSAIIFAFLFFPGCFVLLFLMFVIFSTRKRSNRQEKTLFIWALLVILTFGGNISIRHFKDSQVRYYCEMPDNETLTVWRERVIFDKYTSCLPPRSNYIQMPPKSSKWEIALDTSGNLGIWVSYGADKVKICNPKYKIAGIYESYEGNEQFDTDFPREQQRMSFFYWQMRDGLSGFTHRIFTIIDNDSVYTKFWDEDVSGIPELKTSVCPLDSFIVRKDTILYPHKGYFPMYITKNANNP